MHMDKILKYLMLLLVTTFSLMFTACGGGDDKDEPDIPNPPEVETPESSYGGYVQNGGQIIIFVADYQTAEIRPSSDMFSFSGRTTYIGAKIAFIGNFKKIEDISGLNGSYEWRMPPMGSYLTYEDVKENDCFLIESTFFGSSYYHIYQFGPSKKNLSGDIIGHYYNLRSYNGN